MTSRGLGLVVAASLVMAMGGVTVAACTGDDPPKFQDPVPDSSVTPIPTNTSTSSGSPGAANGAECTTDGQCASSHCVDKVCCESTCSGTCERCNDPNALGKCSASAAGTDPDSECPAAKPVDAGVDDAGDLDGAVISLVQPDGGPPSGNDGQCASKCDGNRACTFPGSATLCGPKFCVDPTTEAAGTCDSEGHCTFDTKSCTAFGCPDGGLSGCSTACTQSTDCQTGFFCAGSQGCKPTLGLGVPCTSPAECGSGFCANNICCDSPCNANGGDQCSATGQCKCAACSTGPCALWYKDADLDGYGDRNATLGTTAEYDCADSPTRSAANSGWSKNKLDCFDGPGGVSGQVHPGADFHEVSYQGNSGPSWDWDCSGLEDHEFATVGASSACRLCGKLGSISCAPIVQRCGTSSTEQGGYTCGRTKLDSCAATLTVAYREATTVACGDGTKTLYSCGACSGGTGPGVTTSANKKQRCK